MNMKISLIQYSLTWADPQDNFAKAERLIDKHQADVYVLPEMFATGFCMKPEKIAQPDGGGILEWMRKVAVKKDAAIVGSVAVESHGCYYNRMYFVEPSGKVSHYDKRHLFTYSGEDKKYSRGEERVVVEYKGIRFLLQVCYDLRFPVWARNRGDYDAVIYVASWPESRIAAWDCLLAARAIENQCYVIAVNRVGDDPVCHYPGHSAVFDAYGQGIVALNGGEEAAAVGMIDLEALQVFRRKFPVLDDADTL